MWSDNLVCLPWWFALKACYLDIPWLGPSSSTSTIQCIIYTPTFSLHTSTTTTSKIDNSSPFNIQKRYICHPLSCINWKSIFFTTFAKLWGKLTRLGCMLYDAFTFNTFCSVLMKSDCLWTILKNTPWGKNPWLKDWATFLIATFDQFKSLLKNTHFWLHLLMRLNYFWKIHFEKCIFEEKK